MVVSGGASVVQLPVLGWFTQIGIVAFVMTTGFFGVPAEPATACAATLLVVTFLGIVPVGLVWAQIENVSLRKVAARYLPSDVVWRKKHGFIVPATMFFSTPFRRAYSINWMPMMALS